MKKLWTRLKQINFLYMSVAFICAIFVWLYVDITQEPDSSRTIYTIPVYYSGQEELEEKGLMVTEETDSLSLTFSGTRSEVSKLKRGNVSIQVDLAAQITKAGDAQEIEYNVSFPTSAISGVKLVERSSPTVRVSVVERKSKEITVRGIFAGSVSEGYMSDEKQFHLGLESVSVTGEASLVDRVDHAEAVLSAKNLTDSWKGILPLELVDKNGVKISAGGITLSETEVEAVYPVMRVKTIHLSVDIKAGGGATEEDVTWSIYPETIKVSGTREELEKMDTFYIGSVDLSQVITTAQESFPIDLPDGVGNVTGTSSAKVTVSMGGDLATTKMVLSDFKFTHVPEGLKATPVTESLEVLLRGKQEVMKLLVKKNVTVEVDLSDLSPDASGTISRPASIHVKGMSDVGAIDQYEVALELSPAEPNAE